MNVLVACEFSGTVRNAFLSKGHNAYSCDIVESSDNSERHLVCSVFDALDFMEWDLLIAHPPTMYPFVSIRGKAFQEKEKQTKKCFGVCLEDSQLRGTLNRSREPCQYNIFKDQETRSDCPPLDVWRQYIQIDMLVAEKPTTTKTTSQEKATSRKSGF